MTKEEIGAFWRSKKEKEEEHLRDLSLLSPRTKVFFFDLLIMFLSKILNLTLIKCFKLLKYSSPTYYIGPFKKKKKKIKFNDINFKDPLHKIETLDFEIWPLTTRSIHIVLRFWYGLWFHTNYSSISLITIFIFFFYLIKISSRATLVIKKNIDTG